MMYQILRAIRSKLINDAELTQIVSEEDITSSYNDEKANYPCIVMSIVSGSSQIGMAGITKLSLRLDVYSDNNKEQLWTIYERIRVLLHNQGQNISNSSCIVHYIYESEVSDNYYDGHGNAWHLSAQYEILYSITGLNVLTVFNGIVYADRTMVRAIPSQEIANFQGRVILDVSYESIVRSERERFGKNVYFHTGSAKLIFEEMIFKPSILEFLWNINVDLNSTLNDGLTSATVYKITQGSYPSYLQVLFQMRRADDGKKLEIEADRAICQNLMVPFSNKDFSVFNCEWILLGDNLENVVKVLMEN